MSRLIGFVSRARVEFLDAINYYESQQPELGLRFEAQIDSALRRIQADPTIFRFVTATVQKARVHRFPHSIYFVALPDIIGVVAVYDGRRDPEVLRKRLIS
jgi:plasmid stabilization system protein ParE